LFCDAVARLIVEAACRAVATNFLLLRQKKVSKEKATLLPVSLRGAKGNLRCSITRWAAELTALLRRFVQTTAANLMTMQLHPAVQLLTL